MTYGIVTAILILALIAVVLAVVFATDDETEAKPEASAISSDGAFAVDPSRQPSAENLTSIQEEDQPSDIRIVDVPAETDRDTGAVRI